MVLSSLGRRAGDLLDLDDDEFGGLQRREADLDIDDAVVDVALGRRLAVAAQHVVLQAAQTIVADKTVAIGGLPTPEVESVTMHELTDKTQDAIAMAVKMNGPTTLAPIFTK